jgi:serine/threonine-protein kinase
MSQPQEGDVLAGKFRIERVLGVGGMGMVVSAMHLHLDERVAIKFLLPEALANAEAVARFSREARAAVKIKSEHVARVIDVATLETGAPYMVMELLRGRDLSQMLSDHGAMPAHLAVQYVLQACEALAEAHAMGMVHRDLKPANLFLTSRADGSPCVKVLDFGISKVTSLSGSGPEMGMTRTQTMMGSPLYMSPEQMASARDVDQRADIWAMGTVLYELVTGRVPFEAETMPQLCAQILNGEPAAPRTVRPDVPPHLEQVIWRCLRKDRAQRYANVAELAAELASLAPDVGPRSAERISRVLSASGASSPTPLSSAPPGLVAASNTGGAWVNTQTPRKSRAVWFGLGGVAAAAAIGVVVWKAGAASSAPTPDVSAAAGSNKPPSESVSATPPPALLEPAKSSEPSASPAPTASSTSAAHVTTTKPGRKKSPVAAKPTSAPKGPSGAPVDPLAERN